MGPVLIVDDDRNLLKVIKGLLASEGIEALTAGGVDEALLIVHGREVSLIITDLRMPGKSGMDLLELCRAHRPAVPVVMVTAHGDIETAVTAMKRGAYDFITKPFDEQEFVNVVRMSLSESEKNRELISSYFDAGRQSYAEVIGQTPAIGRVMETVRKVATTDATVLITGETGVGKELIAKALHASSDRRDHPFVKVNCAAIPDTLAESELFGYERGAFTGAAVSKPGRFELAHRGTIFLDEIGDMAPAMQSRFLGVLQDREFTRVGGVKTIKVDLRVIAATNRDLDTDVPAGRFRADLLYRLKVVPIHVPALRERREDIPRLVGHFLEKCSARHRKAPPRVLPEVLAALTGYDWPGNIRELENVVERMVLLAEIEALGLDQVPAEIRGLAPSGEAGSFREKLDDVSHAAEKQMLLEALGKTDGNRTKAAQLLGISRRTLQNKIKEYGL